MRPHRAHLVHDVLQSEDICRVVYALKSQDLHPIQYEIIIFNKINL